MGSWKWCNKCCSMFYAPSSSFCWDKERHDYEGSINYQINISEKKILWQDYPLVFSDVDCSNISKIENINLPECQSLCLKSKNCNAINHYPDKQICEFKKCKPDQLPKWFFPNGTGFSP